MANTRSYKNGGYEYHFTCNKCGAENSTTRAESNREQIRQACSNCGKVGIYTAPGCRNHHGLHSNLM